jgi:hypothetical protein
MAGADARPERVHRSRALVSLAGLAIVALFALAVFAVGGHLVEPALHARDAEVAATSAHGEPDQALPIVHAARQQTTARPRLTAFVLLAAALFIAVSASWRRIVRSSSRVPRALPLGGRPPGRAPPRLRIA